MRRAAVRRGLVAPGIATLLALAVLSGLGMWQLERKTWKENLIDAIGRKLAAAPVDLPPAADWAGLDRQKWQFRRVRFAGEFRNDAQALVYTTGSTLRSEPTGPRYWVFAVAGTAVGLVSLVRGSG